MPGVKPAKVFVIGAGVVGTAAARMAAGLGADVTICDISLKRLAYLTDVMPQNVKRLCRRNTTSAKSSRPPTW